MSEEIIPCQWCGKVPVVKEDTFYDFGLDKEYTGFWLFCENPDCPVCGADIATTREIAIRIWNTRPREDALQAENERLRELLQAGLDSAACEADWFDWVEKAQNELKGSQS